LAMCRPRNLCCCTKRRVRSPCTVEYELKICKVLYRREWASGEVGGCTKLTYLQKKKRRDALRCPTGHHRPAEKMSIAARNTALKARYAPLRRARVRIALKTAPGASWTIRKG
jgi:hypothetical protein